MRVRRTFYNVSLHLCIISGACLPHLLFTVSHNRLFMRVSNLVLNRIKHNCKSCAEIDVTSCERPITVVDAERASCSAGWGQVTATYRDH